VDALGAVDGLRDVEITGEAAQHVGVGCREAGLFAQKRDHLAQRLDGALVEVGVHAHGDVVARCLGARPRKVQVIANDELERAAQRRLDGGDVDLAVALAAVAIAAGEEAAFDEHRQVEG
jgi:hypothetical protein